MVVSLGSEKKREQANDIKTVGSAFIRRSIVEIHTSLRNYICAEADKTSASDTFSL